MCPFWIRGNIGNVSLQWSFKFILDRSRKAAVLYIMMKCKKQLISLFQYLSSLCTSRTLLWRSKNILVLEPVYSLIKKGIVVTFNTFFFEDYYAIEKFLLVGPIEIYPYKFVRGFLCITPFLIHWGQICTHAFYSVKELLPPNNNHLFQAVWNFYNEHWFLLLVCLIFTMSTLIFLKTLLWASAVVYFIDHRVHSIYYYMVEVLKNRGR